MSARSNQDNQREFEERAMKQIISMVNGNDMNGRHCQSQSIGGSFVRLEAEWREKHRQNKAKANGNKL